MKLGTIVYKEEMYNLDYMSVQEVEELLAKVEEEKKEIFSQGKKITERLRT